MAKKKRDSIVNIRVTHFEKQRILHHAKQGKLTISEYLRQLVITNELKFEKEKENVNEG
jgi:2-iminoacetate synthase ThiH